VGLNLGLNLAVYDHYDGVLLRTTGAKIGVEFP
jgi:hypothetical protein